VRITYVTETFPPEINGVSLGAARTVNYLRGAGHQVQLVRPRQRGESPLDSAAEWRTPGGPIPLYPELRYGFTRVADLRRRWLDAGQGSMPDLVHVTTPGPLAWVALRAACAQGIATSADFRTNFHAYSHYYGLGWLEPLVLGYLRRLHAMAQCNFVPTGELAARLAAQGFERLQVVGRGVDAERFSPVWRDPWLRRQWGAQAQDPVLLHVGRLAPEKNVQLALDTFEHLRLAQPGLRMVVVGDGPSRRRLQRAHPQACFVGVQRGNELARHYASADIFLFPSLTDTFGNVTLEAMASGLAVVAFDTAAAAQHVQAGSSGWLVPPLPGERASAAFCAAAECALAQAQPDSALRRQAVLSARRADWGSVLRSFEQRLCQAAGAAVGEFEHAAVV
jgi:glycosyltransferase involved in cell wall biosynthesis